MYWVLYCGPRPIRPTPTATSDSRVIARPEVVVVHRVLTEAVSGGAVRPVARLPIAGVFCHVLDVVRDSALGTLVGKLLTTCLCR